MDTINEPDIRLAVDIFKKTLGSEIEPTKKEDIPNKINEILSKCLRKEVVVEGNGLDNPITATIVEND